MLTFFYKSQECNRQSNHARFAGRNWGRIAQEVSYFMLTCSGQEQLIISTNHSKSLISGIHLAYISRLWHCGGNEGYFGAVCNIHRRSRRLKSKRDNQYVADELASQRMYVGLGANGPLYVVCRGQMLIYSILSITRLFGIKRPTPAGSVKIFRTSV